MVLFTVALLLVAGCGRYQRVMDGTREDSLNLAKLTCTQPYELTRDCSPAGRPSRKLVIDDFEIRVAGSGKGDVILVRDESLSRGAPLDKPYAFSTGLRTASSDGYESVRGTENPFDSPHEGERPQNSFHAVRGVMTTAGIQVNRVVPVRLYGDLQGYVLEVSGDGYSALTKMTGR